MSQIHMYFPCAAEAHALPCEAKTCSCGTFLALCLQPVQLLRVNLRLSLRISKRLRVSNVLTHATVSCHIYAAAPLHVHQFVNFSANPSTLTEVRSFVTDKAKV